MLTCRKGHSGDAESCQHEVAKHHQRSLQGTTNLSRVGIGTTADAVRNELATGQAVGGRFHSQKAADYARGLENWLRGNPNAPYKVAWSRTAFWMICGAPWEVAGERPRFVCEDYCRAL